MHKITIQSPITLIFSIICIIVYLIGTPDIFILGSGHAISMGLWIFGHANINHLINNLMFILILGSIVEARYDKIVFIFLIFITALLIAYYKSSYIHHLRHIKGNIYYFEDYAIYFTRYDNKIENYTSEYTLYKIIKIKKEICSIDNNFLLLGFFVICTIVAYFAICVY